MDKKEMQYDPDKMRDLVAMLDELGIQYTLPGGTTSRSFDMEERIYFHLRNIGCPAHIKGYQYLISAIQKVVENLQLINAITKELYPAVAREFQTTPSRVERAIRHAIECTWDRGDIEILQGYFGNTISLTKGKPTNSEFVAQIAHLIRHERKKAIQG